MSTPAPFPYRNLAGALGLALCMGAAWSLITLVLDTEGALLAVPAGVAAAIAARWLPIGRAPRGAFALLLFGIACGYALYLRAATVVTRGLGLGFGDVLSAIGPDMALSVVLARLGPIDGLLIAGGAVLAVALAARPRRGT
jgi:hypothetical protein